MKSPTTCVLVVIFTRGTMLISASQLSWRRSSVCPYACTISHSATVSKRWLYLWKASQLCLLW